MCPDQPSRRWGPWGRWRWRPADLARRCRDALAEISARRPLAYSTLADLVHHVRQHLPLSDLSLAVQLFAKNIDDESLPSSIQTMSCKLLLNLVDCIRSKSEQESGNGRDVLMRMLEVRCPAPPPDTRLHPRLALCARLSALPAVHRRPGRQARAWVFRLPGCKAPLPHQLGQGPGARCWALSAGLLVPARDSHGPPPRTVRAEGRNHGRAQHSAGGQPGAVFPAMLCSPVLPCP